VNPLLLALLIAGIGIGSYLRARRDGTWSWREFAITLAGIGLILAVVVPWGLFLMRLGPDHAIFATVLMVIPIALGVTLLARYLSKRRKNKGSDGRLPAGG
jgi:biotin transporter BioY